MVGRISSFIFLEVREFNMDLITPGQRVRFDVDPGKDGRRKALGVAVVA